jgi:hypothetical protein
MCCVVGPTMPKPHPRRPIVGKLTGNMCLWRSSGRMTNAASLHDIWSMTVIAAIGGVGGDDSWEEFLIDFEELNDRCMK